MQLTVFLAGTGWAKELTYRLTTIRTIPTVKNDPSRRGVIFGLTKHVVLFRGACHL